jgi:N-acetylglucosaminyldiphosphoundecaprenol N-acetyl-beta-D-mannosaminyltransferase
VFPVLGVQIDALEGYEQAKAIARESIRERKKTFCVAINPEKIHRATLDKRLSQALEQANLRICDGVGAALAIRILHGQKVARCTGVDLFLQLVEAAAEQGWKVFFLGASEESNEKTVLKLRQRYPDLQVVGQQHGFFASAEDVVARINAVRADLLFVAMGSPRQEFWIHEHLDKLTTPFCMGVGGSFDVVSGKATRAPFVFRKTGSEWLYRLLSNPARVRRQLALPKFALQVLRARLAA